MSKGKVVLGVCIFILGFLSGWYTSKILGRLIQDETPIHIQPSPPAPAPLECPEKDLDHDEIRLRIKIL